MAAPKSGDQNGSVEEFVHPRTLFGDFVVAIFAFAVEKISDGGVCGFTLVDPDAEFLLEHDILADGTESDAFAFRFQMEGVAGSELQAVTKRLRQNDATSFIESELCGHDGSMEWEKPVVNGIWQENEAGPRGKDDPGRMRGDAKYAMREERGGRVQKGAACASMSGGEGNS